MNVTSIAISIGTFILGFAANKLLDWITGVASKQLKKRTIDCNFHDFYNGAHRDVVITSSGFPFFSPFNIKASLNSEKAFLLAMPVGVDREDKEKACFSSVDRLTESFDSFIKANSLSETLEEIRREVYQSFCDKTQGNYFNGKTLGVNHIDGLSRTTDNREQPILSIDFFETDYYTHKIIGRLLDKIQFDSSLVQKDMEGLYSWSRNSFGISLILIIPKDNMILLTKRSKKAAFTEDKEWIYVSVTEALSETDFDEETGAPDISKAVFRGIQEELGIKEIQLKSDTLRFYESFYETHFHQDNIVASIELSDTLSFKGIAELLAKDKFMEIKDVIPLPKNKKEIATFIENNEEQMRSQTIFTLESFMARLEE